ncbi:MAG: hypothetical protein LQ351_004033 [Letrouitia transgressa]|nr:MAG: hypothetical protein LQ351_004033 [Letrouitia transgressa]
MTSQARTLEIESWILYSIGLFLIAARMKLQIDDYIMLFIVITFTGVVVSANQVAQNLSNYLPPGVAETFTPEEKDNAIYGSKFVMILEEFMLTTTWLVKACLLILYNHMTMGLKQHRLVKIVGGYCIFGYVLVQVLYLAVWCRPIQQYWQVPVDNPQCGSYYHHLITATVFNISSDLMILSIPLPILVQVRLPLKRKIVLCAVFSLGVFVILAAILNRYYNFTAGYGSLVYLNWYVGEAATAVFVANVPHLWPLLSRLFALGSFNASKRTGGASSGPGNTPGNSTHGRFAVARNTMKRLHDPSNEGYIRSELDAEEEERVGIAGQGAGMERSGRAAAAEETGVELGDLEQGRGNGDVVGGLGQGFAGTAVSAEGKELGSGWAEQKRDDKDRIVKTVHIQQFSE